MAVKTWDIVRIALAVLCLLAGGFFYLVAESSINGLGASDPMGNGLASGFALFGELALWVAVAVFVSLCCARSGAPFAVLLVNTLLVMAGAFTSLFAVSLMETPTWVRLTPTLMPPLAALCGAWTAASGDFSTQVRQRVAFAFALIALPLAILPFYEMERLEADRPRREAEAQKAQEDLARSEQQAAAAAAAQFQALGADAPLERYMAFFWTPQREPALAAVRALPSRQADTVRLIDGGIELYRLEFADWNLAVTPELCASYRRRLGRPLADPQTAPNELVDQVDNFRWLLAGGCDLRSELTRLVAMMRANPPSMSPGNPAGQIEEMLRATPASSAG